MATITKNWGNGDLLTLITGTGSIAVSSDKNNTGADRQMTIDIQTTNEGVKVTKSVTIKQSKLSVAQDGYWVHKTTNVKTYFGADAPFITNGVMGMPSWIYDAKEIKLCSGVTAFEELYNPENDMYYSPSFGFDPVTYTYSTALLICDLSNYEGSELGGYMLTSTPVTSIILPDTVTSIGGSCFFYCTSLTDITLPNSLLSLGNFCFYGCPITSITLPNSLLSLGNYCFCGCPITSITLPDTVTSIGVGCFYSCSSLVLVTCNSTTPPAAGLQMFYNTPAGLQIKVPAESVNAYKTATNWAQYASKISAI
jgi:hypothetical protein